MEKLKELFESREAEMSARMERLTRYWNGESIGRPPVFFVNWDICPRQIFDDEAKQFERTYQYSKRVLDLPGDTIPIFWPDFGSPTMSTAFGGEIISEGEGSRLWVKPIITSLDQVKDIEHPNPISGLVKSEFDRCRRFYEITGGMAPISIPDPQGPMGIASLLMDQTELLMGMYEKPDEVRQLLRLCTDLFLGIYDAYQKEFGDAFHPYAWPMIWMPKEKGMTLTQDSIPTLSPDLYRDFELPLTSEISEKVGGVYVHCCGTLEHMLDEVGKIPKLRGVDHAYSSSNAEKVLSVLGTDITLSSMVTAQAEVQFPTYDKYLEYLLPRLPAGAKLWYVLPDNNPKVASRCMEILGLDEMKQAYDRIPPLKPA